MALFDASKYAAYRNVCLLNRMQNLLCKGTEDLKKKALFLSILYLVVSKHLSTGSSGSN